MCCIKIQPVHIQITCDIDLTGISAERAFQLPGVWQRTTQRRQKPKCAQCGCGLNRIGSFQNRTDIFGRGKTLLGRHALRVQPVKRELAKQAVRIGVQIGLKTAGGIVDIGPTPCLYIGGNHGFSCVHILRRVQIELAQHRFLDPRHLKPGGFHCDLLAHPSKHQPGLDPGGIDIVDQRLGEDRIVAKAVKGHVSGIGCISDQHARTALRPRQTPFDLAAIGERIVAARIQHDDTEIRVRACETTPDIAQCDCFVADLVEIQLRETRRQQMVLAAQLNPVPGKEQKGDLGTFHIRLEPVQRLIQRDPILIDGLGDLETKRLQPLSKIVCIVERVFQRKGRVGIVCVANDQSHPAICQHRSGT